MSRDTESGVPPNFFRFYDSLLASLKGEGRFLSPMRLAGDYISCKQLSRPSSLHFYSQKVLPFLRKPIPTTCEKKDFAYLLKRVTLFEG
jgi:hypothetical protein